MQDYTSLRVAAMICATLVNTQTYIQTRQLLTSHTTSSASWAANGSVCYRFMCRFI